MIELPGGEELESMADEDRFGIGLAKLCHEFRGKVSIMSMAGHLSMMQHVLQDAEIQGAKEFAAQIGALVGGTKH